MGVGIIGEGEGVFRQVVGPGGIMGARGSRRHVDRGGGGGQRHHHRELRGVDILVPGLQVNAGGPVAA